MENRIHCSDLRQFAELVAMFQQLGLAFEGHARDLFIDVTGY